MVVRRRRQPSLDRSGLEQALGRVQVVLHNQDNREHDLLDSDDYYQFHGGLSAAVEEVSEHGRSCGSEIIPA